MTTLLVLPLLYGRLCTIVLVLCADGAMHDGRTREAYILLLGLFLLLAVERSRLARFLREADLLLGPPREGKARLSSA